MVTILGQGQEKVPVNLPTSIDGTTVPSPELGGGTELSVFGQNKPGIVPREALSQLLHPVARLVDIQSVPATARLLILLWPASLTLPAPTILTLSATSLPSG